MGFKTSIYGTCVAVIRGSGRGPEVPLMGKISQLRILTGLSAASLFLGVSASAETSSVPSQLDLSMFPVAYSEETQVYDRKFSPAPVRNYYRIRKVAVFRYRKPIRVGNNDLMFKFRVSHKPKKLVKMELLF
jgi:hypothetical protein